MTDRMTLNAFLNLFSNEMMFLIKYHGVTLEFAANYDTVLSFYYDRPVKGFHLFPENQFCAVDIGDYEEVCNG